MTSGMMIGRGNGRDQFGAGRGQTSRKTHDSQIYVSADGIEVWAKARTDAGSDGLKWDYHRDYRVFAGAIFALDLVQLLASIS
jgi:hypothetical protein